MTSPVVGPFELVGEDDAPTCVDGVCALPEPAATEPTDEESGAAV